MAEPMPIGSTPVLVQNDRSSVDVTASIRIGGICSNVTGSRGLAGVEARKLDRPGAVVDDRFGDELEVVQLARVGQSLAVRGEHADGRKRARRWRPCAIDAKMNIGIATASRRRTALAPRLGPFARGAPLAGRACQPSRLVCMFPPQSTSSATAAREAARLTASSAESDRRLRALIL